MFRKFVLPMGHPRSNMNIVYYKGLKPFLSCVVVTDDANNVLLDHSVICFKRGH